jgi:endonuclease/exonuclease/phosphatase family metal-dependent hydrolase
MIYDTNKNPYNYAFDVSKTRLNQAYDINKNPLLEIEPPTPTYKFKVMSYNVGSWTAFGVKATLENQETWYTLQNSILNAERADLLGIQEYYSAIGSYSVTTMLGQYYEYLYAVDWVSTKAGRAIASKYLMTNTAEINFQHQNGEQRSYLIGDVAVEGKTIKFITAHLALDNATIALQIGELLEAVRSFDYWILTGDFNIAFPNSQSDGYAILVKPFLDAGYNVANGSNFGFIPTFSTKKPGDESDWRCLDNIMCSSNITITNVYVNRQKITEHVDYAIDHLPLIAEMEIEIPNN